MKTLIIIAVLLLDFPVWAQTYGSYQNFCQVGGTAVLVWGMKSTNLVQGSFPSCTVTVHKSGTTNLATIYKDANGTPLDNPFKADLNGSFLFYSLRDSFPLDVTTSGAGIRIPFTYRNIQAGSSSGGGGGVIPGTQYQIGQYTSDGINIQPSNVTTDATGNNLTVPGGTNTKIIDNVTVYASQFGGSTFDAKINSALNECAPTYTYGNCIIDARGLTGSQILSTNITLPNYTTLLLGSMNLSMANNQILVPDGSTGVHIKGFGPWAGSTQANYLGLTHLSYTGDSSAIQIGNQSGVYTGKGENNIIVEDVLVDISSESPLSTAKGISFNLCQQCDARHDYVTGDTSATTVTTNTQDCILYDGGTNFSSGIIDESWTTGCSAGIHIKNNSFVTMSRITTRPNLKGTGGNACVVFDNSEGVITSGECEGGHQGVLFENAASRVQVSGLHIENTDTSGDIVFADTSSYNQVCTTYQLPSITQNAYYYGNTIKCAPLAGEWEPDGLGNVYTRSYFDSAFDWDASAGITANQAIVQNLVGGEDEHTYYNVGLLSIPTPPTILPTLTWSSGTLTGMSCGSVCGSRLSGLTGVFVSSGAHPYTCESLPTFTVSLSSGSASAFTITNTGDCTVLPAQVEWTTSPGAEWAVIDHPSGNSDQPAVAAIETMPYGNTQINATTPTSTRVSINAAANSGTGGLGVYSGGAGGLTSIPEGMSVVTGGTSCTNGTQTISNFSGTGTGAAGTVLVSGGVPTGFVTFIAAGSGYAIPSITGQVATCTGLTTFIGGSLTAPVLKAAISGNGYSSFMGVLNFACTSVAGAGFIRMCNTDTIDWKNHAGTTDNMFASNAADQPTWNGTVLLPPVTIAGTPGNCLYSYNASTQTFATAPCAAGTGSGTNSATENTTSTSLTTNWIPKANGANSIVNSSLTDDGTNVSTPEGSIAKSFTTTGAKPLIASGTASNSDLDGQLTLVAGTVSYSFANTYTSAPICTASDTTALEPVQVSATTTTLTVTGTATDVIDYICVGRN